MRICAFRRSNNKRNIILIKFAVLVFSSDQFVGEFFTFSELIMDSNQQFKQNTQMRSGLTSYRSAPSSYFAILLSDDDGFGGDDLGQLFMPSNTPPPSQPQQNSRLPPPPPTKSETEEYQPPQMQRQQSNDCPSAMYPSYSSEADTSYSRVFASFNSNSAAVQPKVERSGSSGLIRHSSSPAGLFNNINIENDFKTIRGMESYGGSHNNANAEASLSSASRLMSGMDPISEIGTQGIRANAQLDEDHGSLIVNSWDDSTLMSDYYYLKGTSDNDYKSHSNANASDDQKKEEGNRPKTVLSHHLSLPKTSSMEKLMQDSVPCKIRAKRGFATHPRSIAERVRRTKISDRIRKLQELVPNMDKQTNTSGMLDLAVDYIKELQRTLKTLSDSQAKCNCSAKQRP